MKVYVHLNDKTYPVVTEPQQNVSYVCNLVAGLASLSSVSVSKFPEGKQISPSVTVGNYLENMDDLYVVHTEEHKQPTAPKNILPENTLKYQSLTKYSFYESGKDWVRVIIPLEGANQLPKDKVSCTFAERSFNLLVHDLKSKNYQFTVPKLQCFIEPSKCKYSISSDKVRVSLKKLKQEDNWHSLFRVKAIGEDDD